MTNKAKKPAKAAAAKAATAKSTAHKAKPTPAPAGPNPLLERWTTPFEVPPFDKVRTEHFLPAIEKGFADNLAEIAAIANNRATPTFANTIDALEGAGRLLDRVSSVFFNLSGTDTTPHIQAIEREVAPRYAKHSMGIYQNAKLFARVDALMKERKKLGLTLEQTRVLERYHRGFVKAGAKLDKKAKTRLAKIAERSASLGTLFGQNVLKDEQNYLLVLDGEADLAGLPDAVRAAAAQAATDRGKPGQHVITLSRSSIEPFLQYSARRDLREQAFKAWIKRGAKGGKTDNRGIVREMLGLRAERAQLLGYRTAADSTLEFSMAKTPAAVRKLLMDVWGPARKRALQERDLLQQAVQAEGGNFKIAAWDWRHYAEKVRKARYDVDEAQIKPYLQLDSVIAAAFDVAGKLFGVSFKERKDLPVYHPEVRTFEVLDKSGKHVGLFFGDYYARPSKRSGAWMSGWRDQYRLGADVTPIVVNVMNFAKGAPGEPSLLSLDDARTLFHEFGHGLHGLLSNVTYPALSGTSVERDFVELPSQLYEHWLEQPEVLRKFARHYKTGKTVPEALLKRIKAARTFNQGFATVEYLSSAIVDIDLHVLKSADKLDVDKFEADTLARIDMPEEIVMRHRIPHFQHIIGGYAAGYYSYMWSEVMDADAFRAFEETGNVFDPATAKRLRDCIYSAGGSQDPADAYKAFRGRLPDIQALLDKRGLSKPMAA
ncbi:MAG TPA: M3 family metallopeptidase [Hyphomicrobiaceae bacterium]|nr:M3 family metallopeptidase [Hyphomicrobiaceae bacterium]